MIKPHRALEAFIFAVIISTAEGEGTMLSFSISVISKNASNNNCHNIKNLKSVLCSTTQPRRQINVRSFYWPTFIMHNELIKWLGKQWKEYPATDTDTDQNAWRSLLILCSWRYAQVFHLNSAPQPLTELPSPILGHLGRKQHVSAQISKAARIGTRRNNSDEQGSKTMREVGI